MDRTEFDEWVKEGPEGHERIWAAYQDLQAVLAGHSLRLETAEVAEKAMRRALQQAEAERDRFFEMKQHNGKQYASERNRRQYLERTLRLTFHDQFSEYAIMTALEGWASEHGPISGNLATYVRDTLAGAFGVNLNLPAPDPTIDNAHLERK